MSGEAAPVPAGALAVRLGGAAVTLQPEEIGDLATAAIEARVVSDEDKVLDVLQTILVDGTKRDALAFVVACLYTISCGVVPGMRQSLGAIEVRANGQVTVAPDVLTRGNALFATMLSCYLHDDPASVHALWLVADDEDAAGAVGAAIATAAVLVRNRRARLN